SLKKDVVGFDSLAARIEAYDIANIYDDIKEIKIVKPFKNPVILNEYNIYMGDDYISLSLSEEFIKVNDETFRIIDSGDNYKELLREIKESFLN
ncbi:hypothetical protein G6Z11_14625, partial [Clostridium perfringens]|nr:hypothetical protein [Clostridium perfringens]